MGNNKSGATVPNTNICLNNRKSIEPISNRVKSRVPGLTSMANFESLKNKIKNRSLSLKFDIIEELGRGTQADVFSTKLSDLTNELLESGFSGEETFALKRIYKNRPINIEESLMVGQQILIKGECPFIIEGVFSYEDENYIHQLMKHAEGGDMSTFLGSENIKCSSFKKLGEKGIQFIAAGIILCLEHLHNQNFIYCDLKLENVLIDVDGYPRLTDFEMCRKGGEISSDGYRGTIIYIAPDLFSQDYVNKAMDIWALGICIYFMATGEIPYDGEDVYKSDFIDKCEKNENKYTFRLNKVSKELKNLINSLLKVDPNKRLGYNSLNEIKNHPFFRGFDWEKYSQKELVSPLQIIVEQFLQEKERTKAKELASEKLKVNRKRNVTLDTNCDDLPNHHDVEF